MSTPLVPLGSKLYRRNPSTNAWEEVPHILSMGFPGSTQEYDDVTTLTSPAGSRERVATVKAPRDMPVEILFSPTIAMHNTMIDDSNLNPVPLRSFAVLYPDTVNGFSFSAFPGSPDGTLNPTAALRVSFTLGVSGAVTRLTAGLPA